LSWRYKLSEATYKVSVFTKGVLDMETTFVALVAIDPKQLLEDGIRKELVAQIAASLHTALTFQSHQIEEFEMKLNRLAATLDGFKRSFTCSCSTSILFGIRHILILTRQLPFNRHPGLCQHLWFEDLARRSYSYHQFQRGAGV
jgi:WASH complex subunit strumpellin